LMNAPTVLATPAATDMPMSWDDGNSVLVINLSEAGGSLGLAPTTANPLYAIGRKEGVWTYADTNYEVVTVNYGGGGGFWARITGNTEVTADHNQWTYSFVEIEKTTAGYGGWTTLSGGRTGTDTAYNSIEDMNDDAGVQGNGVDVTNLDTADYTFALQPAPTGAIVRMWTETVGSTPEYWFAYENGVDGECD
jgi:hypothetical protein